MQLDFPDCEIARKGCDLLSGTSSSPLSAMIAKKSLRDHGRLAGDLKSCGSGVLNDLGAASD
jgi:hypothetical protein